MFTLNDERLTKEWPMVFKVWALTILLSFSSALKANLTLPYNQQLLDKIITRFGPLDQLDLTKIDQYIKQIEKRRDEIKLIILNYQAKKRNKSPDAVAKKIKKEKVLKIYNIILQYFEKLKQASDIKSKALYANHILELDYALKVAGVRLISLSKFIFFKESIKKWSIPRKNKNSIEASDLVNPTSGNFLSASQISNLKRSGKDLSRYNPPVMGTFWDQHQIENIDIKKITANGQRLYRGIPIIFPTTTVKFKKIRKTQSKPKLDVTAIINGKKIKFKLKVGSEMHSEATATLLYSAIGYPVDVTKYARDIKVNLKDMTPEKFYIEWNSYYNSYPVKNYIKASGIDEHGDHFITFTEGLFEYKPKSVLRVGPWAVGENGIRGKRAARASLIFNMWVSNLDLKEAENNKLIIRKKGNDEFDFFHLQHDMGFAFGKRFREKPGAYPWQLVKKVSKRKIHMNFNNFQKNSGFDHVTFYDGKWMVRLIARLSRAQIQDAVALGGWPAEMDQLLVEKLIARRNQLVEAFELSSEFKSIPFDRYITTENGVVVDGELKQFIFDDYTQDFGHEFSEMMTPFTSGLRNYLVQSTAQLSTALHNFSVDPAEFGWDEGLIVKVIFGIDRQVTKNLQPTSGLDQYLVRDHLSIGFRLGAGFVITGDMKYIKDYTLVYPVATKEQGFFSGNFIMDVFLPYKAHAKQLPPNSVLIMEDSIEGRGRVKLLSEVSIPFGDDISASKVLLKRQYLSRKEPGKIKYFEDLSIYNRFKHEFYIDLKIVQIPLLTNKLKQGHLQRTYFEIDIADDNNLTQDLKLALDETIVFNRQQKLIDKSSKRIIDDDFIQSSHNLRFFNFFKTKQSRREDYVTDQSFNILGDEITRIHSYQIEHKKSYGWSIFDNGEEHKASIRLISKIKDIDDEELYDPLLTISLRVNDKNTVTKEIDHYINFLNKTVIKETMIPFTPALHAKNNLWGNSLVYFNLLINEQGMHQILSLESIDILWGKLALVTGFSADDLQDSSRFKHTVPKDQRKMARRLRKFYKYVDEARYEKQTKYKLKYFVKAIRKIIYKSGQTYRPEILSIIVSLISPQNFFLSGFITLSEASEIKFPARTPFYNERGNRLLKDHTNGMRYYIFNFDDADEIYHYDL